jgi:hypothetical protein
VRVVVTVVARDIVKLDLKAHFGGVRMDSLQCDIYSGFGGKEERRNLFSRRNEDGIYTVSLIMPL